ncbi:MAG: hypothetical protein IJ222_11095 [Bacteroidales bacterium]|nr:hypothetical protein [Bacteroidales bacterium]
MKRLITILTASIALAAGASAQTMSDALTFSRNNYYGTARTIGMGNAVTAVGGDIGTIAINPAGGSVSAFSQFSFSTGFTTSSSESSYTPSYAFDGSPSYGASFNDSKTRMTVPNIGLNLTFDTGSYSGVKSYNFGFLVNRSQTFTNIVSAAGSEGRTSITGAFATAADGMPGNILGSSDMWDSGFGWNGIAAYDGGLVNYNGDAGTYYGSGETKEFDPATGEYEYGVRGILDQRVGTTTKGSRNDMIFNYGVNVDDRLFLGINLSIPFANYSYSEFFEESRSSAASDFPVTAEYWDSNSKTYVTGAATNYERGIYEYSYKADITGINAKIGAIWLPADGLRLGAAIQTPTAYSINERWYVDVRSEFGNTSYNASSGSPTAETSYNFRSPYSANFGIAYTFGRIGMLSVDYEFTDFSIMKFSEYDEDFGYSYDDPFHAVNRLNKLFCGVSHSLRIGAEVRPVPAFSLRAGFNLTTDPERYYTDTDGFLVYASDYDAYFNEYENGTYKLVKSSKTYVGEKAVSFSFGAGYSSPGSFYADLALRRTTLPERYYQAYQSYLDGIVSPVVRSKSSLFDAVLTLGWRF